MLTKDIKPGVVYAYQSRMSSRGSAEPVVVVSTEHFYEDRRTSFSSEGKPGFLRSTRRSYTRGSGRIGRETGLGVFKVPRRERGEDEPYGYDSESYDVDDLDLSLLSQESFEAMLDTHEPGPLGTRPDVINPKSVLKPWGEWVEDQREKRRVAAERTAMADEQEGRRQDVEHETRIALLELADVELGTGEYETPSAHVKYSETRYVLDQATMDKILRALRKAAEAEGSLREWAAGLKRNDSPSALVAKAFAEEVTDRLDGLR